MPRPRRAPLLTVLLLVAGTLASGCGAPEDPPGPARTLRLGYFANITHATPLYGVRTGAFQSRLGATRLRTQVFNAGPAAIEALFAGSLDAVYVGPAPAVNAFIKSRGGAVVVAGATSGGSSLVVRPGLTEADLPGSRFADPQTGGTQDVALRHYLAAKGWPVDRQGRGAVTVLAQENAQTLELFRAGRIDGGWLPEPWASRLVVEGGGQVLVDERSLWPGGRFVTTNLLVKRSFLERHPETVKALLEAQVAVGRQIRADPRAARRVIDDAVEELSGKRLAPAVSERAFDQLELTDDPLAATLKQGAEHAFSLGLLERGDLSGIYDLRLLREVLGRDVADAGLGPA